MTFTRATAILLYVFLYLPLLIIVLQSFNASSFGGRWSGWTMEWYSAALSNSSALAALKVTFLLAICSTVVATILGTTLGYGLARHTFRGKNLLERLLLIPLAVPDIVMAVALLLFYALIRSYTGYFNLGFGTMFLAHITFQVPFVALVVRSRMRGLDPVLDEAAYDLGASRWQRLRHVTLPLMRPGILAGALLAFTLSLDDFVVSFFTGGPGSSTVSVYIYGAVKRGLTPEIHALSSFLILAAIVVTLVLQRINPADKKT